jgi:putative hydrolase of the HAD superfamily
MNQAEFPPQTSTAVIFDGDDTLWSTEELYDDARAAARAIVAASGLDGNEWERLERQIDIDNVPLLGYSMRRFPTSCVQAYEQICHRSGVLPDPSVSALVTEAAESVFARSPAVLPGAHETLAKLRARGVRLALLTKGDPVVQHRRVGQTGLSQFFDVIEIVPEKSPQVILEVTAWLSVDRSHTWMVGNSVRSDILPALEAGLHAIWIDSHVWEHERTHDHLVDERVITAAKLDQIPEIVAR